MPTYGFDETVTESEWSKALAPATPKGVVFTRESWRVTFIPGLSRVLIAKGSGQAAGIHHVTTSDSTLDIPKPTTGGRWYLVVATYDWPRKTVEFRAIAHNTTGDSSADLAPASMPGGLRAEPGVAWDQPLAFVWIFSGAKSLETVDLRLDRMGLPAALASKRKVERGGNATDNLNGNFNTDTAAIMATKFTFPRGEIRYYVTAILRSTAPGGAGAAGRVRISVNGNAQNEDAPYLYKSDWDQYTYTGTYMHPGGVLSIGAYSSTTNGQVTRDGTKIEVDWFPSDIIPE